MKPLLIGLTGGIAAGKTTAGAIFAKLGDKVVDADTLVQQVYQLPEVSRKLAKLFASAVDAGGEVSIRAIRDRLRQEPAKLKQLEGLIHPHVARLMQQNIASYTSECFVGIVPLMFEVKMHTMFDKIISLSIPGYIQSQRVLVRDGMDEKMLDVVRSRQMQQSARDALADAVLEGDMPLSELETRIISIRREWLIEAKNHE